MKIDIHEKFQRYLLKSCKMSELADLCPKRDRDEDEDELTIPRAAMNKMIKEVML